jgi:hypothetical protein
MGRDVPLYDNFFGKMDSEIHKDIAEVARSIFTNQIKREGVDSFIQRSYAGTVKGHYSTAVGFIDTDLSSWLKKNEKLDIGEKVTIALEARLLNGQKAARHSQEMGDAVGQAAASTILDALLYGQVYSDHGNGTIIYLFPHSQNKLTKITVNPRLDRGIRGLIGPAVVNIESIGATGKDGEFNRIIKTLKKIK